MPTALAERRLPAPSETSDAPLAPTQETTTNDEGSSARELEFVRELSSGQEDYKFGEWDINLFPRGFGIFSSLLAASGNKDFHNGFRSGEPADTSPYSVNHHFVTKFIKDEWGGLHPLFHPDGLRLDPPPPIFREVDLGEGTGQVDLLAEWPGMITLIDVRGASGGSKKRATLLRYAGELRNRIPEDVLIMNFIVTQNIGPDYRRLTISSIRDSV